MWCLVWEDICRTFVGHLFSWGRAPWGRAVLVPCPACVSALRSVRAQREEQQRLHRPDRDRAVLDGRPRVQPLAPHAERSAHGRGAVAQPPLPPGLRPRLARLPRGHMSRGTGRAPNKTKTTGTPPPHTPHAPPRRLRWIPAAASAQPASVIRVPLGPAVPLAACPQHCPAVCIPREQRGLGVDVWEARGGWELEELGVVSASLPLQIHGSSSRRYKYPCALVGERGN